MCNWTNLKRSVEAAASASAKQLGYGALKDVQLEVIKGGVVLFFFSGGFGEKKS